MHTITGAQDHAILLTVSSSRQRVLGPRLLESVHARLRKIIKTRGHFPSDDAATKLIWLALRNITADWGRAAKEWRAAMNQFAIAYGDRFIKTAA
jgi:transposase-like protein